MIIISSEEEMEICENYTEYIIRVSRTYSSPEDFYKEHGVDYKPIGTLLDEYKRKIHSYIKKHLIMIDRDRKIKQILE